MLLALTGVGAASLPSLNAAIQRVLDLLYYDIPLPQMPVTDKHVSLDERNRQICAYYTAGETLEVLAEAFALSSAHPPDHPTLVLIPYGVKTQLGYNSRASIDDVFQHYTTRISFPRSISKRVLNK